MSCMVSHLVVNDGCHDIQDDLRLLVDDSRSRQLARPIQVAPVNHEDVHICALHETALVSAHFAQSSWRLASFLPARASTCRAQRVQQCVALHWPPQAASHCVCMLSWQGSALTTALHQVLRRLAVCIILLWAGAEQHRSMVAQLWPQYDPVI